MFHLGRACSNSWASWPWRPHGNFFFPLPLHPGHCLRPRALEPSHHPFSSAQPRLKASVPAGFVCQLDTSWSFHRERSLPWGNASMRSSSKAFSQLVIKGGRAHCGWSIPGLVVLGSIRKQAEQARGSKPVSSIPPWSLHQLLPPSSCPDFLWWCESVSWINPFLPNLLLGHAVLCRNRNPD